MEGLDEEHGEIMGSSSGTGDDMMEKQKQMGPSYGEYQSPGQYYPYNYQPMYSRYEKRRRTLKSYVPMAEVMMIMSGILGIIFWGTYFFLGYYSGSIKVDVDNVASRMWFGFSIIMLMASIVVIYGAYFLRKKDFKVSFFCALFGIFSFGFGLGSVMAAFSLGVILNAEEDFHRQKEIARRKRMEKARRR